MSDQQFELPPPNFEFLVYSLKAQAEMQLGLLRLSEDQPDEPNLPGARHAIDMLAMIQAKTKGNLDYEEQLLMNNALTELRFRFVQRSEKAGEAKKDDEPRIILP